MAIAYFFTTGTGRNPPGGIPYFLVAHCMLVSFTTSLAIEGLCVGAVLGFFPVVRMNSDSLLNPKVMSAETETVMEPILPS